VIQADYDCLDCIVDLGILLPTEDGQPTVAHQLFWSTRSTHR